MKNVYNKSREISLESVKQELAVSKHVWIRKSTSKLEASSQSQEENEMRVQLPVSGPQVEGRIRRTMEEMKG